MFSNTPIEIEMVEGSGQVIVRNRTTEYLFATLEDAERFARKLQKQHEEARKPRLGQQWDTWNPGFKSLR